VNFAKLARLAAAIGVLRVLSAPLTLGAAQTARGTGGAVAAAEENAAKAGIEILEKGGNAADAAVAVAFALAVTWPEAGNLGGGGFWTSRDARGRVLSIDFRETAPRAARRDLFAAGENGGPAPSSTEGPLASGVPGSVAGLALAHRRAGHLPWKTVIEPAMRLARDGFVVSPAVSESIAGERERLAGDPDTARIFLPGGAPPAPGTVWKQPDLARTLEAIRDRGEDGFYRGPVARAFADGQKNAGGLITRGDLARYDAKLRRPLRFDFRGLQIITTPAPSSGPVLAEMALLAEAIGPEKLRAGDASSAHWLSGSRRRVPRPQSLPRRPRLRRRRRAPLSTSTASGSSRRRSTRTARRRPISSLGDREKPTTTHFSVIDRQGMGVSVTTTLNDSFGNARVAPGLGFLLNNEMDDFATRPGQKNMYGLVQGEVNAVAPGKRMLSSMCPSIAVDHGRTVLVWGTPGGATIPTTNLQVLLRRVLQREGLDAAVAAARFHQQDLPDEIQVEKDRFDAAWVEALQKMGHTITDQRHAIGRVHAVAVEADGTLTAVADPRGGARGGRRPGGRPAGPRPRRVSGRPQARPRRPSAGPVTGAPEIFRPLYREGSALRLLDQRLLPAREVWLTLTKAAETAAAIRDMAVRGAPAIGVAAAYGAAFSMRSGAPTAPADRFGTARRLLASTRPTAVNLFAALDRMEKAFARVAGEDPDAIERALIPEADAVASEDIASCLRTAATARSCCPAKSVLTHCNAGALATSGYGTALGVIRGAVEAGKAIRVLADETRPFLQGARLTAWELKRDGIPVEIITDGMAGHFLASGEISAVVVGADRIAANGDAANKIGTYGLAVLARENGPFYIAAPMTTVDFACAEAWRPDRGTAGSEVLSFAGPGIGPAGVPARYAAFDVTPARYVTAIVTDRGICRPPYGESLRRAMKGELPIGD
jgi:gamma-glutamyltranspeptidase/glutathione hydrolase